VAKVSIIIKEILDIIQVNFFANDVCGQLILTKNQYDRLIDDVFEKFDSCSSKIIFRRDTLGVVKNFFFFNGNLFQKCTSDLSYTFPLNLILSSALSKFSNYKISKIYTDFLFF